MISKWREKGKKLFDTHETKYTVNCVNVKKSVEAVWWKN